jgi:hypothetical protein
VANAKKKLEQTITSKCRSRSKAVYYSIFILLHSDDPRAALGCGREKEETDGDPGKSLQRLDFESASSCSMRRTQTVFRSMPMPAKRQRKQTLIWPAARSSVNPTGQLGRALRTYDRSTWHACVDYGT